MIAKVVKRLSSIVATVVALLIVLASLAAIPLTWGRLVILRHHASDRGSDFENDPDGRTTWAVLRAGGMLVGRRNQCTLPPPFSMQTHVVPAPDLGGLYRFGHELRGPGWHEVRFPLWLPAAVVGAPLLWRWRRWRRRNRRSSAFEVVVADATTTTAALPNPAPTQP